jgi:hypothetical protein
MRFAISKNSQPPSAMLAGQRMKGSSATGIRAGSIPDRRTRVACRDGARSWIQPLVESAPALAGESRSGRMKASRRERRGNEEFHAVLA